MMFFRKKLFWLSILISIGVILSILVPFYTISFRKEENSIKQLFHSSSLLIQIDLSSQLNTLVKLFNSVCKSFGIIDNYNNTNIQQYNYIINNLETPNLYTVSYCPLILNNERDTYEDYISNIYGETLNILSIYLENRTVFISDVKPRYFPLTLTNINTPNFGLDIYQVSTRTDVINNVESTLEPKFGPLSQIILDGKLEYVIPIVYPLLNINNQFKGVIIFALRVTTFFEQLDVYSQSLEYYIFADDKVIFPTNEILTLENFENQGLTSIYNETILNINFKFIVNANNNFKDIIRDNERDTTLMISIILLFFILILIILLYYFNEKSNIKMKKVMKDSVYNTFNRIVSYFSHEIRNSLNSIYTILEFSNESNEGIPNKEQTTMIFDSITRVKHFVDEMLSFQKLFDGKIHLSNHNFNIIDFSKKIIYQHSLNSSSNIMLYLYVCPMIIKNPIIYSDSVRVSQILLNGLSNAIKLTSSGYISLEIYQKVNNNKYISFKLKNSGTGLGGINPNILFVPFGKNKREHKKYDETKLFSYDSKYNNKVEVSDVFNESKNTNLVEIDSIQGKIDPLSNFPKQNGSGMGLPISKMLSIVMGGDLRIYDEFKDDVFIHTSFHSIIMVNNKNNPSIDMSSRVDKSYNNTIKNEVNRNYSNKFNNMSDFDEKSIKILIVDDTSENLNTGKMLLSRLGYEVDVLTDGIFIDYKTIDLYDVILLDIIMAHSSGFEVCTKLINNNYTGVILATTGYVSDEDINNYKSSGFNGVYSKPFQIKKTDAFIKEILLTKEWNVLI
jgi:CheY-like chemotaxis protein